MLEQEGAQLDGISGDAALWGNRCMSEKLHLESSNTETSCF
jgi:hypothetical protein